MAQLLPPDENLQHKPPISTSEDIAAICRPEQRNHTYTLESIAQVGYQGGCCETSEEHHQRSSHRNADIVEYQDYRETDEESKLIGSEAYQGVHSYRENELNLRYAR